MESERMLKKKFFCENCRTVFEVGKVKLHTTTKPKSIVGSGIFTVCDTCFNNLKRQTEYNYERDGAAAPTRKDVWNNIKFNMCEREIAEDKELNLLKEKICERKAVIESKYGIEEETAEGTYEEED